MDTVAKRASSLLDDVGIIFPPDGSFDEFDRVWMLGQYAGIAAGEIEPPTAEDDEVWRAPKRRRDWTAPRRRRHWTIRG